MRLQYAALENSLESEVYEIRDDFEPNKSLYKEFVELPTELPELDHEPIEYFYFINLDRELLTMNFTIHWKLGNIPRQDYLWLRSITKSIYEDEDTISLDICPEENLASPALEIPERNVKIHYARRLVNPRKRLVEAREIFLTEILAGIIIQYRRLIRRIGLEWRPESFPFRELAFSLVSIASNQAKLHYKHHTRRYYRPVFNESTGIFTCRGRQGWLDREWVGDSAPLLEFGSLCHRPGEQPGVSPMDTIYWHEGVLVSLQMVNDGSALNKAVAWGIERGHANFQIVILSLFEVAFAEVSMVDGAGPFVEFSHAMNLSPLSIGECLRTHPRTRPAMKSEADLETEPKQRESAITRMDSRGTSQNLQKFFPGLACCTCQILRSCRGPPRSI